MNKILRAGVDTRVALDSELRKLAVHAHAPDAESATDGTMSFPSARSERSDVPAAPEEARSLRQRIIRRFALALYRPLRPIIRPIAYRLRGFLLLGMRETVADAVRTASTESARESRDRIGHALDQSTEVAREALKLAAESVRALDELSRTVVARMERSDEQMRVLQADTNVFHSRLTELAAMVGRIEPYSLASASRVAVPCESGEVLVRTAVGYVLCSSSDHALLAILMESGELEPGVRQLIQRLLRAGDVFVDIGANVGMHTIAAAQAMEAKGRIFAFEPFKPTARLLERTVWLNGFSELVEVQPLAVSDVSGERSLFLGKTSGHHSLYPLSEAGPSSATPPSITIQCVRLDEALPPDLFVDLIKMDVEGAELEVLASSDALLAVNPELAIIAEFAPSHLRRVGGEPLEWLREFERRGFARGVIDEATGRLEDWSVDKIASTGSVNLFFSRPGSRAWDRARA